MIKLPSIAAALVLSTASSSFAITDAEIAPAVLAGKTLTFTIVNGGSPYPTTGTWSGAFAASGNAFSVANISGDTVPISTTWSASIDGIFTDVALGKFVEGQAPATLSLYTQNGVGHYEVFISGVFGVSLNGTFTIDAAVPKIAEIDVNQGKAALKDGKGKVDFSTVLVTKKGKSRTKSFVITNSGDAPLKNLGFSVDGKNRKEFQVSAPKISTIAPGASVTIRVAFSPKAIGVRKAELHIKSNDQDESPFDVKLSGNGGGKK